MCPITISEYYDYDRLTEKLETLEAAAPELMELSSIGQSRDGRELWCMTVASRETDPPADRRPALLVTANMHARELAGSWVVLHFLRHLADEYGSDEDVTRVLDEQTVYVIPRIAPDGADDVLESRHPNLRSRAIDVDEADRRPGALYAEDVDGDGQILTMRWESEDGEKVAHPDDGRALVDRTAESAGPYYRTELEGIVHEYDGEDVVEHEVRSDFNRNFPSAAWRPFDWYGHGEYPLSEPETRAVAEFLIDHRNVTGVADLHTGNPAIFYPRTLADPDEVLESDATLLEEIGERGAEITGFQYLSSYGEAATGEPTTSALPGSFKDYVYERAGVPAYVIELGMLYNSLGLDTGDLSGIEHQLESTRRLMEYHDEHPEYGLFREWESVDHPQLGEVEIGGWDMVRFANPPLEEIPEIADRTTAFLLEYAEYAPSVEIRTLTAEPVGSDLYRIAADVVNGGAVPTNITEQGRDTEQDERPLVTIDGDEVDVVTGSRHTELDHLEAHRGRASLEWVVGAPRGTELDLQVTSPNGVFATESVTLDR